MVYKFGEFLTSDFIYYDVRNYNFGTMAKIVYPSKYLKIFWTNLFQIFRVDEYVWK